jgi:hypothetical protein
MFSLSSIALVSVLSDVLESLVLLESFEALESFVLLEEFEFKLSFEASDDEEFASVVSPLSSELLLESLSLSLADCDASLASFSVELESFEALESFVELSLDSESEELELSEKL